MAGVATVPSGAPRRSAGAGRPPPVGEPSAPPSVRVVGPPNTVAAKVGSRRLAVLEALAADDPVGLVIPEIVRASGVPKSTVHRVIAEFEARRLVVQNGRRRKAPVYRLNPSDDEVADVVRVLRTYVVARTGRELEAYRARERAEGLRLRMLAHSGSRRGR